MTFYIQKTADQKNDTSVTNCFFANDTFVNKKL